MFNTSNIPAEIMQDDFVTELMEKSTDMFSPETFLTTSILAERLELAFNTGIELEATLRAFKNDLEDYVYCLFTGKTAYLLIDILDNAEELILAAAQQNESAALAAIATLKDNVVKLVHAAPEFNTIVSLLASEIPEEFGIEL